MEMGKIAFFSSLLLILAFLVCLFFMILKEKGANETKEQYEERMKEWKNLPSIDGGKIFKVFAIIAGLLLTGWFVYWLVSSKIWQANNKPSPTPPPLVEARVEAKPVEQKVIQRGTLTWEKPEEYEGKGNPNLRKFTSDIVLHRNDSEFMEFTQLFEYKGKEQEAHFRWNKKRENCGSWYQEDPETNGSWYLEPKEDTDGKVWEGWIADGTAVHVPLKLEL